MPRARRVTRELLLRTALHLVQDEGLDALTMRRLGQAAGVDPAMVYRCFASKEELVDALADVVFAEGRIASPRNATSPEEPDAAADWAELLRRAAHGIRRALLSHPSLIPLAVRRPPRQAGTFRGLDAGLGLLLGAGLSPEGAAKGYQAVLFYTLGFAAIEAPFATAPDGGAGDQAATHDALAALPAAQYPHITATIDHLYGPDLDEQFDYGLRLLIAGLAAQARDDTA